MEKRTEIDFQTKIAEKMMGVCLALSIPPSTIASVFF
jgi:hypothetical protein